MESRLTRIFLSAISRRWQIRLQWMGWRESSVWCEKSFWTELKHLFPLSQHHHHHWHRLHHYEIFKKINTTARNISDSALRCLYYLVEKDCTRILQIPLDCDRFRTSSRKTYLTRGTSIIAGAAVDRTRGERREGCSIIAHACSTNTFLTQTTSIAARAAIFWIGA